MNVKKPHFIVIDDSKLDCFVAERLIQNTGRCASVTTFYNGIEALEYIDNNPFLNNGLKTIILLDIQMPLMDGHQFIEAFEKLPIKVQNNYIIYMISSSTNENDLNRISNYHSVTAFFNKPVTTTLLLSFIIDVLEKPIKID